MKRVRPHLSANTWVMTFLREPLRWASAHWNCTRGRIDLADTGLLALTSCSVRAHDERCDSCTDQRKDKQESAGEGKRITHWSIFVIYGNHNAVSQKKSPSNPFQILWLRVRRAREMWYLPWVGSRVFEHDGQFPPRFFKIVKKRP